MVLLLSSVQGHREPNENGERAAGIGAMLVDCGWRRWRVVRKRQITQ